MTDNCPSISVIIPVYNAEDTIELTLRSVIAQTYTDFEVIVVDDASTDDTVAVAEKTLNYEIHEIHEKTNAQAEKEKNEYGHKEHKEHIEKKHKIISLPENMGPAGARNAAIAVAEGEWIAFLDGDDLWPAYKLEVQVGEMDKYPDAVLSCGFSPSFGSDDELAKLRETENGRISGFALENDDNRSYPKLRIEAGRPCPKEDVDNRSVPNYIREVSITDFEETNPVATSTVLVKRDVLLDVGGFDESFRGPEDMDLWLRIVVNHRAILLDIPLALYRERAGSLCMDSSRFLKEVLRVYDKAFADGGALYEKRYLKKRTVATRYTSAAWGALNEGLRWRALYYLLKSWVIYPRKIVHEMRYPYWRLKVLRKVIFNIKDTDS